MPRKYPYYPAWDGGKASELITTAASLLTKRYKGSKSLGTYVNRDMRDKPGQKSVHATGYALDWGYAGAGKANGCTDEELARKVWDYLLEHSAALGICEVHWYKFGKFGAGYRCSRGEGKAGVKIYADAAESAGTGGPWLHIEIDHEFPGGAAAWEQVFRATKPA